MEKIDKRRIPKGMYCYRDIGWCTREDGSHIYKVKHCPYLVRKVKRNIPVFYCKVLKEAAHYQSIKCLIWDSIKECGIKDEI